MKTLNNLLLLVLCMCFSNWAIAQGGTDCSTATTPVYGINSVSYTGSGASSNAANPNSATSCAIANFGAAATSAGWFAFVPTNNGTISVASCEQGEDTRLSIYSGSCAALSCLGYIDDNCAVSVGGSNFAGELNNVPVTAGDTVFIEWDDRWTTTTHDWSFEYTYCSASDFGVTVSGTDATVSWNTASTSNYTYSYGPVGATDPLLFTLGSGMSGSTVTGMAPGSYDFYLVDSCYTNGVSLGATPIGPISVCVPGYAGVNTAPISEGFEDCGIGGITDFWIQSTMDQADWTPNSGATGSFQTGPSGPNEGAQYVYLEVTAMAIGDIAILESQPVDFSAVSIPTVRFDYHMYGSDMGTLIVEARDTGAWVQVWSMSGDQGDQWYTADVNLAAFLDTVQIRFVGDDADPVSSGGGDISLDNVRFEEFCLPVMTAPYIDGFEGGASCMINSMMDVLDWNIDENGTPSNTTGPSTGYNGSQYYAFIETSTPVAEGDSAIYTTPLVDIAGLDYPELTFGYHMYGAFMGSLRAEITNDGGTTWMALWEESGNQGDEWHMGRINLDNAGITADTIQVRFVGIVGPSWSSDMAIDDVSIANGVALDLVTTEDMTMYPSCASSGVPASFEVTNFGFADITAPFTYGVEINGTLISQTYTDTIPTGTSKMLTFNTGLDLMVGMNTISYGFVGADFGDEDMTNDMLDVTVMTSDVADGDSYASSYEGSEDGWRGTGDFEWGVPAATIITGASDGTDAWVTGLAATYHDSEMSYLYSPCFDFSAYASDPNVNFDVYWDIEDNWDAAWLEVSTDGGNSFSKVGSMGTGTNWYNADVSANNPSFGEGWNGQDANNSGGWVVASNRVMGTAGEGNVQFRFVMASDVSSNNEGLGVDNFKIEDYCPADLGLATVVTMATPGAAADASASVTATNGTAPYTYAWSDGQTTAVATGLDGNMTYDVTVTDANGCTDIASISTMFTSTDLIETMTAFDVFPNPTNTTANVVLAFEEALDVNIELVNVLGQVIFADRQEGATSVNLSYDVSTLSAGVYMVRIMANGQKTSQRLVITE